ncbi:MULTISPECIES: hypothetical protein [Corallincola]|uniref:Uncharacterized protein n=3 Tax=Corallincola TaxID=1775176 RepID=A0A368NK96_9GAMM|nr:MULTISPECIES: hypothetical protein [Corallincola]RCU50293.1 hypothetical protein DU002_07565 [Corallincola holothuriorum]TAA48696.1 hypothetical protein EXY25_05700 [Corallincola spongiicola]TCI05445.1 hypothetical protein EZV61_05705 [Corallincola luteus]
MDKQNDANRLAEIANAVAETVKQPEPNWQEVLTLATEADGICQRHQVDCPFDVNYIRSIAEIASAA